MPVAGPPTIGCLPAGQRDSICDVEGVTVGHVTLIDDDRDLHTGITAIVPPGDPFVEPLPAAVHTINGYGKPTGFEQIRELGELETPIILTSTLGVGAAHTGLVQHVLRQHPSATSVNPVVAECNDGWLSDAGQMPQRSDHVHDALAAASTTVAQGCVGAGAGTSAFGWKGGIGTASRTVPAGTIGVLAQTNMGRARDLVIAGVPVGRTLTPETVEPAERGSVVMVVATDLPLDARQLGRLARRAQNGLARTGAQTGHGSGEFVIAFSTCRHVDHLPDSEVLVDDVGVAVAEAVEQAVLASMFHAHTVYGRDGRVRHGLPVDAVRRLLSASGLPQTTQE